MLTLEILGSALLTSHIVEIDMLEKSVHALYIQDQPH